MGHPTQSKKHLSIHLPLNNGPNASSSTRSSGATNTTIATAEFPSSHTDNTMLILVVLLTHVQTASSLTERIHLSTVSPLPPFVTRLYRN